MRSGIIGFILGAVLAVTTVFIIHRTPHGRAASPAATVSPAVQASPVAAAPTVPRWPDAVLPGASEDWSKESFRVNVLHEMAELPSGPTSIPARVFLAWDKGAFNVRVEVDATETSESTNEKQLWLGDSIELFFSAGTDLKQTCQVIVAPGFDPKYPTKRELVAKIPDASPKPFPVKTNVQRTATGYVYEFSLPWSAFGVTPTEGQTCAVQVVVHHWKDGELRTVAWYPATNTASQPEQKVSVVLGGTGSASPSIDALAQVAVLNPHVGQVFFNLAPDAESGHTLTVRHGSETLYRSICDKDSSSFVDFFPLPSNWTDAVPLTVCDNDKVLATMTHDEVLWQIQRLSTNFVYRFRQSVFGGDQFPTGEFEEDELVRRFFAPVKVITTFYNAQYQEVTHADKPGRYGAVVRIHLSGGPEMQQFFTLYRTQGQIDWRETPLPMTAQMPPVLGLNPASQRSQTAALSEGLKSIFLQSTRDTSFPAILLAGLSEIPPGAAPVVKRENPEARDIAWWDGLRQRLGLTETYQYIVDLPEGYATNPDTHWPVILSLHGSGQAGANLEDIRKNGLTHMMGETRHLPAIIISPQCPYRNWWKVSVLSRLLDEVAAKYRVDEDRIYVTGLSMGGFGTWDLALAYPDRFAAIVPICGIGDPRDAARLKRLPIWVFHGQKDERVAVHNSVDMVNAIRQAGGHPHLTIYPDVRHNSWVNAYATDALYTWLLAQKRGQPEVKTPGVPAP